MSKQKKDGFSKHLKDEGIQDREVRKRITHVAKTLYEHGPLGSTELLKKVSKRSNRNWKPGDITDTIKTLEFLEFAKYDPRQAKYLLTSPGEHAVQGHYRDKHSLF
ncbi:MAG: hypothetical protein KKF56_03185 [Nanoarchaeota archaeon]|nr:hypothetical protein [Nanoarchaeota archaeon]